nr:TrmH family RNA methyltransferase [Ardenticatena sp.]
MQAEIRHCPNCNLRYPWHERQPHRETCPRCGAATACLAAWNTTPHTPPPTEPLPPRRVALVLDNLRSAWNVGALFRTADGLGVAHLYLCGITPTPKQANVRKTALGAETSVAWTYAPNTAKVLQALRQEEWVIWALEQPPTACSLRGLTPPDKPLALVVGNEVSGVGPDLFPLCDQVVYVPMQGIKRSLNVEVAAAIALWHVLGMM